VLLGTAIFILDWTGIYRGDYMLIAFFLCVLCLTIMAACAYIFPDPLKEEARPLFWEDCVRTNSPTLGIQSLG
jgi:hypothetical protein